MMEGLFKTIRTETRLFRQPRKIGETFELKGMNFIVIGIEKFEVSYDKLIVWYTCQNLNYPDYISKRKAYKADSQLQVEVKLKHDDERLKTKLYVGSIHFIKGHYFKFTEIISLKLDGTDLKISFFAKAIHPMEQKEAKAKLLDTRKQKLQLEVF